MKKLFILLFLSTMIASQVTAQKKELRKKYYNLGFSTQRMTTPEESSFELKSNYGAVFTYGRTYFVHKKKLFGMMRIGIDATWTDINYANYKLEYHLNGQPLVDDLLSTSFHQLEVGVQAGPSVTITPLPKFNIHGYFRYAPTFSALYIGDSFEGGYAGYFVGGGAVYYGAIGLGLEARFGNSKYKPLGGGEDGEDSEGNLSILRSQKNKFSGMRVYLTFRF